ncbi:potassium channel family protein [Alteribacillus iranensis]|uniref:Voltage-gated potassium channel n=1 Tax=Alteribacillus iranensis TaxID=930128 RepID=A0A1I2EQF2_9BACI|nr:potassium channel protein [Alteribacillus iranensis]SFE95059.1 voltage-gated potassium channel [Alteribacillus iranensis]
MLQYVTRIYFKAPVLLRLFFIVVLIILTFGFILYRLEPHTFPDYFDAVWWAVITAATIGYGDYVPSTLPGRAATILLVIFGIGFVTYFFTNLAASSIAERKSWRKGTLPSHFKNHYIVVGWNERSKQFVQQMKRIYPERPILLIDYSLNESPFFNEKGTQFIKGNPTFEETLLKAGLKDARALVITAEKETPEQSADAQTILTLLAAKHSSANIYTAAEILTPEQISNAKHAGADEIIASNFISSLLMTESLEKQGIAETMITLLDAERSPYLLSVTCPDDWVGKTFEDISRIARQEEDLILGLSGNGKTLLNPPRETRVQEDYSLFILTSQSKWRDSKN